MGDTKHLDELLDGMTEDEVEAEEEEEREPMSIDERLRRLEELVGGL